MATPTKIDLGAFAAGEIPPRLTHTYYDFTGVIVDISTFATRAMNIEAVPAVTGPLGTGTVDFVTDGTDGAVEYIWTTTDMAEPGSYSAQIWVSNGTNRYASDLILFTVYDGPGDAP
jgi:hypothetical protein